MGRLAANRGTLLRPLVISLALAAALRWFVGPAADVYLVVIPGLALLAVTAGLYVDREDTTGESSEKENG